MVSDVFGERWGHDEEETKKRKTKKKKTKKQNRIT